MSGFFVLIASYENIGIKRKFHMDSAKPRSQRRIAPYDEEAMRKVNIRLTAEQHARLQAIGDGNVSLGARRVIEEAARLERTLPREEWEKLTKKYQTKKTPKGSRKKISAKPAGRPALANETIKRAQEMYSRQGRPIKEIAVALNIHQSTIYKHVDVRKKNSCST